MAYSFCLCILWGEVAGVNPLFLVVGVNLGVGKVLLTNDGYVGDLLGHQIFLDN